MHKSVLSYRDSVSWVHYKRTQWGVKFQESLRQPLGYDTPTSEALSLFLTFGRSCSRCRTPMVVHGPGEDELPHTDALSGFDSATIEETALECPECGWWCAFHEERHYDSDVDDDIRETTIHEGIVKKYDLSDADTPNEVLRAYIEKNIDEASFIDPTRFELLMRDVYSDFFSCEVRHVGGPGDNGVDLYAVIKDEPYLVQVKRRQRKGAEGVRVVREFIGTLILEGAQRGHIVTTAHSFSVAAQAAASNPRLRRHHLSIELKDIGEIAYMLQVSNVRIRKPWTEKLRVLTDSRVIQFHSDT